MAYAPALDENGNPIDSPDDQDTDWFANNPAPASTPSNGGYALPAGVSQAMADDFIRRNPGDYARLASAYANDNTGNRNYDSQGPAYNQATNQLNPGYDPRGARFNVPGGGPGGGGGYDWGSMPSGFGAAPDPFGETYSTLARPSWLQGEYVAPQWSETFTPLSMADLERDPGYQNRLLTAQKGFERSAAAKGTILSGGTQVALGREQQNLAANEYGAANTRAFEQYQARYNQFTNNANLGFQARGVNEGAYNTDSSNNLSQYATRFQAYQAALDNRRRSEVDLWGRQMNLADNALRAAGLARP